MDNVMCWIICSIWVICCTSCLSTNVTVLKVESGGVFGIYDFYLNSSMSGMFGTHYKSNIINDWDSTNIRENHLANFNQSWHKATLVPLHGEIKAQICQATDQKALDFLQVTINIFKEGTLRAYFVFDGENTTRTNWMSKTRLKRTSYTDINDGMLKYTQLSFQDGRAIRRFYISAPHNNCPGDMGWLVVKESTLKLPCNVDKINLTTIWYSDQTTKINFNDFQKADEMTVELNIDVWCDDRNLTIDNMTYATTGSQFNDTLTYRCLQGFTHTSGDLQSRCTHRGVWSGTRPTCMCLCPCPHAHYIQLNHTELRNRLIEIRSNLHVKANETSKAQRLKVCAKDDRPSAKAIGNILGAFLIASLVFIIVASDMPLLLAQIRSAYHNLFCRQ